MPLMLGCLPHQLRAKVLKSAFSAVSMGTFRGATLKTQIQATAPTLKCNAARLQTLCLIVRAIIRHRTANLVVLATTADGKTCSNESRYRRFQDFFLRFSLCMPSVARIILTRIPTQKDGYLPASEIKARTMDREFIGKKWLQSLESQDIGCHLIVISNRLGGKEALAIDQKRWGIERLFGHLKKNGFDLEGTHITKGVKREKLFALVVLAFLFSLAGGSHLREQKIKTSAASHRKSLFRLGLESILALVAPWTGSNPAHPNLLDFDDWLNSKQLTSIFLVESGVQGKTTLMNRHSAKRFNAAIKKRFQQMLISLRLMEH